MKNLKMIMYTMKNSDGICGLPYCAASEYAVAKSIQKFYKDVGEYEPLTWWILGEFDMDECKLISSNPVQFDWEKVLSDKEIKIATEALETSSLAKEIEHAED